MEDHQLGPEPGKLPDAGEGPLRSGLSCGWEPRGASSVKENEAIVCPCVSEMSVLFDLMFLRAVFLEIIPFYYI